MRVHVVVVGLKRISVVGAKDSYEVGRSSAASQE